MAMDSANSSPIPIIVSICIILIIFTSAPAVPSDREELTLVVSQNTKLKLLPRVIVGKSPGVKPGTIVLCERLRIKGLPRLQHLNKFPNSVKVKVAYAGTRDRPPGVEVCFHGNSTLGMGMCGQGQWEKLNKGSWMRAMSPFDQKLLDIRMVAFSAGPIEVSLHEEVPFYRVVFLVLGIAMMTLAAFLSSFLMFYYVAAVVVGVLFVILMVIFQGMRLLLRSGRKNSLAIILYSSALVLSIFLLLYLPILLRTILNGIGITEDIYKPLGNFLMLLLGLFGAWLGFCVVHKLALMEDGSIDDVVSSFVAWSIRIVASVMILHSSIDRLLAAEALFFAIFISLMLRRFGNLLKFIGRLHRRLCRLMRKEGGSRKSQDKCLSPVSAPDTFYSTFHTSTPERRKFTKDEWNAFTRESTKKALESLVSSPDFSRWAVAHADRLTLAREKKGSFQ